MKPLTTFQFLVTIKAHPETIGEYYHGSPVPVTAPLAEHDLLREIKLRLLALDYVHEVGIETRAVVPAEDFDPLGPYQEIYDGIYRR